MPLEEKLVGVSLALEDALMREAWDEADDLFAAREALYIAIPSHAVPREVDDIDARILARLRDGIAEIRRETLVLSQGRRANAAYGPRNDRSMLRAA